jgi:hypothetical protein
VRIVEASMSVRSNSLDTGGLMRLVELDLEALVADGGEPTSEVAVADVDAGAVF